VCGSSPPAETIYFVIGDTIIDANELRATVVEVLNLSAIPSRRLGEPLTDDMRLVNLGIDSLGVVLVFVEMSTRTGLPFERREGMEPLRTVGDIVQLVYN